MGDEQAATGPTRRTWMVVFAVGWALMGTWSLSAGSRWSGLGQLVLAGAHVVALLSPRFGAWVDAPVLRRR